MDKLNKESYVYCTWEHRKVLPIELNRNFRDLDHFIKQLLSSARSEIVLIIPYLTCDGIQIIKDSIYMSIQNGAWLKVITSDLDGEIRQNKKALRSLVSGEQGRRIRNRLRVLTGRRDLSILLHSKIIIVDSFCGYLGSANITFSAFQKNFEVGVSLSPKQSKSLEELIKYWESSGMLTDSTNSFLGDGQSMKG
ncbi:MAG: phospholipase D family protein [Candidatus Omnitrophica bacterium]|nr:phospholipase D family protein [Candidatus Omnitrophota bacterium]